MNYWKFLCISVVCLGGAKLLLDFGKNSNINNTKKDNILQLNRHKTLSHTQISCPIEGFSHFLSQI